MVGLPDKIPKDCPKCGRKLQFTNAWDLCGIYFIFCADYRCRWCEVYEKEYKNLLVDYVLSLVRPERKVYKSPCIKS